MKFKLRSLISTIYFSHYCINKLLSEENKVAGSATYKQNKTELKSCCPSVYSAAGEVRWLKYDSVSLVCVIMVQWNRITQLFNIHHTGNYFIFYFESSWWKCSACIRRRAPSVFQNSVKQNYSLVMSVAEHKKKKKSFNVLKQKNLFENFHEKKKVHRFFLYFCIQTSVKVAEWACCRRWRMKREDRIHVVISHSPARLYWIDLFVEEVMSQRFLQMTLRCWCCWCCCAGARCIISHGLAPFRWTSGLLFLHARFKSLWTRP